MSEKIKQYQQAARAQRQSADWADMLGKPYHGGGGGTGSLHYCELSEQPMKTPTIYFQYSNGDQNYHECPRELLPFLDRVICARFQDILKEALHLQSEDVKKLAQAALDENNALLKAAGLATEHEAK